jgi:hypothetical protein
MSEHGILRKKKRKRKPSPMITGAGALAATAVAAAGGWILYSKVAINRDVPLPHALHAECIAFTSEKSGPINYYM